MATTMGRNSFMSRGGDLFVDVTIFSCFRGGIIATNLSLACRPHEPRRENHDVVSIRVHLTASIREELSKR